jgi:hypothetical protein
MNRKKRQLEILALEDARDDVIPLKGKTPSNFPLLAQYGIPMVQSCIQPLLCDIYSLSQAASSVDLLNFHLFNKCTCSLVQILSSIDYNHFKKNAQQTKWILAFNDSFPKVACDLLGLLLAPKVMDAESACALWEEANRPICA